MFGRRGGLLNTDIDKKPILGTDTHGIATLSRTSLSIMTRRTMALSFNCNAQHNVSMSVIVFNVLMSVVRLSVISPSVVAPKCNLLCRFLNVGSERVCTRNIITLRDWGGGDTVILGLHFRPCMSH